MANQSHGSDREAEFQPNPWPNPESARRATAKALTREELLSTLPVRAVNEASAEGTFPEIAEVEYERSFLTLPFYPKSAGSRGDPPSVDRIALQAHMRILREAPIRNGIGLRQFEFYIDAWEVASTSQDRDTDIVFTLSDVTQPKSICVSLQRESDFPAMIVYNAIYDVYAGKEKVAERRGGIGVGMPVYSVPPRNVAIAFDKPFESDLFNFAGGLCENMESISADEFERGAAQALRIRQGE